MKTLATLFFALVTAVCLSGVPAWAQHGGGGHPGGGPPSGMPGMGHESGTPGTSHGAESGTNKPDFATGKEAGTDVLSRNSPLCKNLSSTLGGMTCPELRSACSGFKNLGQCVAAWHVSHNLGCSFTTLKTGTLAAGGSLGKAIQSCDPKVNAKAQARKGLRQANRDIRAAGH